ncbi:MAG: ferritin [Candidatus Coatesbacteria bacterium]|nr:ferritin [Candidatus Coatesbacteria bacterium]
MMNAKVRELMNQQITNEFYSGYLYQAIAAYFEEQDLPGFAKWYTAQAQEEIIHGFKFYNHIIERGARVELGAIDKPTVEWDSPLAALEAALEHEKKITADINRIYEAAEAEKDYASRPILDWFVDEQIEEEDNATTNVQKFKMVGEKGNGLYMLDKEMGARPYTSAAIVDQVVGE